MTWNKTFEDQIALIIKVVLPLLLIFGTFGNVITVVVFRRLKDYSSMSTFYIALALSDLVLLYSGWVNTLWIYFQFHVDIISLHVILCKIGVTLPCVSSTLSSWYLVAMTMQRAISVTWPHRVNVICTRNFSRVVTAVIGLVIMASYSHILYATSLLTDVNKNSSCHACKCGPSNPHYIYFYNNVWVLVDLLIGSIVPFCLLLVSNIVLIRAVLTSVKNARQRLAVGQSTHVTARAMQASSLSVTLIALSVTFVVLTGPHRVQIIMYPYISGQQVRLEDSNLDLIFSMMYLLLAANSAVNFYLYCLTGTKFRKEVVQLGSVLINCKSIRK